jgi:hypothetical protein
MSPIRMGKIEKSPRMALDAIKAFNDRNMDRFSGVLADVCELDWLSPEPDGMRFAGKGAILSAAARLFAQRPDFRIEVKELHNAGSVCVCEGVIRWTDSSDVARHLSVAAVFVIRGETISSVRFYSKRL